LEERVGVADAEMGGRQVFQNFAHDDEIKSATITFPDANVSDDIRLAPWVVVDRQQVEAGFGGSELDEIMDITAGTDQEDASPD